MNQNQLITICIPTFNRAILVKELIEDLIESKVNDIADILIIDDGSTDNTLEQIQCFQSHKNIQVLANLTNLGVAKTFMRCFDECNTEYLIMMTDDDLFFKDGLTKVLEDIELHHPDFIATTFNTSQNYKSRNYKKISELGFLDIWVAAKHSPGLVYKTSAMKCAKDILIENLNRKNLAAYFFPQIILLTLMKANNLKLICSPNIIAVKDSTKSQSSQLVDELGASYLSLSNVIKRHLSFSEFYNSLLENKLFEKHHSELKKLLRIHQRSLYQNIEAGISLEDPSLISEFRRGSLIRFLRIRKFLRKHGILK
jgi:glycosyltransferase involved in cell wall biosynthesis